MADPKPRSLLIQEQIENLLKNSPPPVTQAERDQIMKGRKGQKDIDAGRAAIDARAAEVKEHTGKIEALSRQLGEAQADERAAEKVRKREESSDPLTQNFLPFVAGGIGGGVYGELANRGLHAFEKGNVNALKEIGDELGPTKDLTSSQMNRSRAVGAMKAAERFAPTNPLLKATNTLGRAAAYGIPASAILYEQNRYQKLASDPNASDSERNTNQMIANGLLGGATGIAVEGGRRFVFPSRDPGMGQALSRIEAARDYAMRMDANEARGASAPVRAFPEARTPPTIDITPQPVAPALAPPAASQAASAQAEKLRHAERLSRAVAAVGSKPGRGKSANYQLLAKGITAENAEAVAKALDLPSGSAKGALLQRARELLNTKGVSSLMLPAAAAGAAYSMASDPANAADGTSNMASGGAAAGAAGATAYGVKRAIDAIPQVARTAVGMMGEASAPALIADMTPNDPDDIAQGRNWIARNMPMARHLGGGFSEAYDMAQVPERRPAEAPQASPEPLMDNQPMGGEDFETQMADLAQMLQQIGQAQEPGPVANARQSMAVARQPMASFPQNRLMARY